MLTIVPATVRGTSRYIFSEESSTLCQKNSRFDDGKAVHPIECQRTQATRSIDTVQLAVIVELGGRNTLAPVINRPEVIQSVSSVATWIIV
jgi:hypothetical protein